tara:strand:- start:1472 stop:2026 length:555 start_codon:yes stop_codon:yes gene_type:complete
MSELIVVPLDNSDGIIREAKLIDLKYIVHLSKIESTCLGFIPKMAYESAITGIKTGKRWSNICNDKMWVCECNGDLVGFVLASFGRAGNKKQGKIAQICIQEDARLINRGRILLDAVISHGKSVNTFGFSCGCADDLPSNFFWKLMGWQKVGARKGRSHKNTWEDSKKGRTVNLYKYDEFDLFQ